MTNHYFDCQVLLMNKTVYDGLPPDLQKIVKEEAINAQNLTRDRISNGEAAVVKDLQQKGMHVTYPDRQSFVVKMKPAYDKVGALAGRNEMQQLLKAVESNKTNP